MVLHARLLWSVKLPEKICYICMLMYVLIKAGIKNDRFQK